MRRFQGFYTTAILIGSLFWSVVLLGGCAAQVPLVIRTPPSNNPSIDEVLADFSHYQETAVRWGGAITSVKNKEHDTWIEVVRRTLDQEGAPLVTDTSLGRFVVRIGEFLDPAIYHIGRRITVYGTVYGKIEGHITYPTREHLYTDPLVKAKSFYLWSERSDSSSSYPYSNYCPWM